MNRPGRSAQIELAIGRARDFEDWFYAASDLDNTWVLSAFPSAWDGAINFQRERDNLGLFDLD